MEYHKTLQGYNPAEAERRFLNLARSQDLYGVDPHPCKVSVSLISPLRHSPCPLLEHHKAAPV